MASGHVKGDFTMTMEIYMHFIPESIGFYFTSKVLVIESAQKQQRAEKKQSLLKGTLQDRTEKRSKASCTNAHHMALYSKMWSGLVKDCLRLCTRKT